MKYELTRGDYDNLVHLLEQVIRTQKAILKNQDLNLDDRGILEQILGGQDDIKSQLEMTRQHDTQVKKDIKEEVNAAGEMVAATVESKVGDLQEAIDNKKVIKVKAPALQEKLVRGWKKWLSLFQTR